MARKKVEKMVATEKEVMFVRLALPIGTHDQFRVAAAENRTTMAELARKLVEDYLAKRKTAK